MLREILSYSVLIFVPVVTLLIATLPYWWVNKRQHPVLWRHLWSAFIAGFGGVIGWWWVIDELINDKIAMFLFDTVDTGILFAFFFYSLFLPLTPFIFSARPPQPFFKDCHPSFFLHGHLALCHLYVPNVKNHWPHIDDIKRD